MAGHPPRGDARAGRAARARASPIAGYIGFDPSAASLHVGHLIPIFGLLQLQRHGGRPVALVGGGTGMIGDPSGRSTERNLLDRATLEHNAAAHPRPAGAVPRLLARRRAARSWSTTSTGSASCRSSTSCATPASTSRSRTCSPRTRSRRAWSAGLSFTEFSYMLLQSYDFWHLHRTLGVELQMGGADQWGNITAGLELIRRTRRGRRGRRGAAGARPRPTSSCSRRRARSSASPRPATSVWLDPARTTPFAFYQYWLQHRRPRRGHVPALVHGAAARGDRGARRRRSRDRPEAREAQRALALDITARTHGAEAAAAAIRDCRGAVRVDAGRRPGGPGLAPCLDRRVRLDAGRAGRRDGGARWRSPACSPPEGRRAG